jgi:hypothetical protein
MKESIMKILIIFIAVLSLIIITAGWFYWFQWRPSQIRKQCQGNIENRNYTDTLKEKIKLKIVGTNTDLYQNCLREHGLEK